MHHDGLVIVITGTYNDPQYQTLIDSNNGADWRPAMGQVISWFLPVISRSVTFRIFHHDFMVLL